MRAGRARERNSPRAARRTDFPASETPDAARRYRSVRGEARDVHRKTSRSPRLPRTPTTRLSLRKAASSFSTDIPRLDPAAMPPKPRPGGKSEAENLADGLRDFLAEIV